MGAGIEVIVRGGDFRDLAKSLQRRVQKVVDAEAHEVAEEARRVTPKKSGASAASIYVVTPTEMNGPGVSFNKANALYKPWGKAEVERIIKKRTIKYAAEHHGAMPTTKQVNLWRRTLRLTVGQFKRIHAIYRTKPGTAAIGTVGLYMYLMEYGGTKRTAKHIIGNIAQARSRRFIARVGRLIRWGW